MVTYSEEFLCWQDRQTHHVLVRPLLRIVRPVARRLRSECLTVREFIRSWHSKDALAFTILHRERRYYRTFLLLHKLAIALLIVQWLLASAERADQSMQIQYLTSKMEQNQGLLVDGTVVLKPGGRLVVNSLLGDSRVVDGREYIVVSKESLDRLVNSRNPYTRAIIARREIASGSNTGLEN